MSKEVQEKAQNPAQEKDWYEDLVLRSGLAEHSGVKGCMIIKPYGFAIWENMKSVLDARFKATGHVNASFPLFIPKSLLSREASHVEGFAKECAVVTHYRLINDPEGNGVIVDPTAKLAEELIVRPTSETIIWNTYKRWIQSYRDLPILINQWANVVRWEMRTRLFLRTAEFHWQEGHTAHATAQEAIAEARLMLDEYAAFMENYMAIPVIKGYKTESERFAGADDTYTCEGLMKDGKALQMGTSHFLGQNFAKAFDVKFLSKEGVEDYAWATSWGVSTRLMGALIMAHADENGLIIPPKLAPTQVVIVPLINKQTKERQSDFDAAIDKVKSELQGLSFIYDDDDTKRSGFKFAEYELRGVPLRITVGLRDIDNGVVEIARRDTMQKLTVPVDTLGETVRNLLTDIQNNLYNTALQFREENTTRVDTFDEFKEVLNTKGGFIYAHWDGTKETEAAIKEQTKATTRCIPMDNPMEEGKCVYSGKPSKQRILFAKAY
ncbi:proline--tRNA ligase [Sphingobacteriales bacterium UPWRP_1]|nr:proline--tRNA ligase [Sphingobacteriales bacterium TSM_CSM]PSJ75685.1 proline--tRNA ligase [Sphingobacteriales bacterium UPWRP_1]